MKSLIIYSVLIITAIIAIDYLFDHSWILKQEIGLIENKVMELNNIID